MREPSPMQTYIASGGDTSNEGAMRLLIAAEESHNSYVPPDLGGEARKDRSERGWAARNTFLTYCRRADPRDYAAWLDGYGGEIERSDREMPDHFYVLERTPDVIPSLYGALLVDVIVPAGVLRIHDVPNTFDGGCGHSTFYFMYRFEVVGIRTVQSFTDTR